MLQKYYNIAAREIYDGCACHYMQYQKIEPYPDMTCGHENVGKHLTRSFMYCVYCPTYKKHANLYDLGD